MLAITQTALAKKLQIKKSDLSKILSGTKRVRRNQSFLLEDISGVDHLIFMDGTPVQIIEALEETYGEINFRKGRPSGK